MSDQLKNENIICFAGEDWWYHNPHSNLHIMKCFAKDNKVLFVNSIGLRMPSLRNDKFIWKRIRNKLRSLLRFVKKVDENLYVMTPFALPQISRYSKYISKINKVLMIVQMNLARAILKMSNPIVWVTLPSVKDVAVYLKDNGGKALVYYCVDNITFYQGADHDYVVDLEKEILKHADLALFVNHQLVEDRKKYNPNTYYIGHGVDFEHFASVQDHDNHHLPEDIRNIKRPIIGYVGMIRELDFELIKFLADKNKNYSFVFIGDTYTVLTELKNFPNIYFLGKKPYEQLPQYIKAFDCCCMYYQTGDQFNDFRNPKKLLEYLATGKPIVSVAIHELIHYKKYIGIAHSYEEFDKCLKEAITEDDPLAKEKRIRLASEHTWEAVTAKISEYIN